MTQYVVFHKMSFMKGIFFSKPLEYNLDIDGEVWTQGSYIKGSLMVSNHSNLAISLNNIGCHLCYSSSKKFKSKDPKSINLIESTLLQEGKTKLDFEFKLKNNCPITESTGTLIIICGDISKPFEGGFLELNIKPMNPIIYLTETFEMFYRFKVKPFKNKKDFIEAPIKAPDSKEWASIQKMALQFKMVTDELEIKFIVTLKRLSFDDSPHKTKDEKKEIIKILTKKEYELYGSANQEGIKKILDEVMSEIKIKPL